MRTFTFLFATIFLLDLASKQVYGCGYKVKAIDRDQIITSPGFPYNYAAYTDCEWTVQATYGSHVFVNITDFDLGSGDFLSIYDGSSRTNLLASYTSMASLSGRQATFTTRSEYATIHFSSNWNDEKNTGFSLSFIMDCLDNAKCQFVGAKDACADRDVGETFCPKLCGSCQNLITTLLG